MEQHKHEFEPPRVTEIVPAWRRDPVRQAMGRLSLMQSLPDNVYLLRPPETDEPEAA